MPDGVGGMVLFAFGFVVDGGVQWWKKSPGPLGDDEPCASLAD